MRLLLIIPIASALLFLAGELMFTYARRYTPPPTREPALGEVQIPSYQPRPVAEAPIERRGTLVVDTLHFNFFFGGELEPILSKVSARGYEVDFFGDRLALELRLPPVREPELEKALRRADSYLVILPVLPYSTREVELVQQFIAKGGKVVVVSDPTRFNQTNSLATALGVNFEDDYLYNVAEHESNYRNVFFRNFAPDELTKGLGTVTMYTASSITGSSQPILLGDPRTLSSNREATTLFSPLVKDSSSRVVAISDFTFMTPPHNAALDNDRLLSNLADFLTTSQRTFTLSDFPFFFRGDLDVVMADASVLSSATRIKGLFTTEKRVPQLTNVERPDVDTVFLGLFEHRTQVQHYLRAADITFADGQIRTPAAPPIVQKGSGLLFLDVRSGRHVLVALANNPVDLGLLVQQLQGGEFRLGLVASNTGLYILSPAQ